MATKRVAKEITNKEDFNYIINLTEDDLLHSHVIMEMFADFEGNGKPRFNTYDTITIPPGYYEISPGKKNTKPCYTTVGIWVFNKAFIESDFSHIFGYINEEITAGKYEDINAEISYALLEDETTVDALDRFINKSVFYMKFVPILSPSVSETMITLNNKIKSRKEDLIRQNKEAIASGDARVVDKIEKELINYSKEILKDDPAYDVYASGAGPDWKNNFKNMFVSRGAVKEPGSVDSYNIIMSSYMDNFTKEDYMTLANTLSSGPYARGVKTQSGGYKEKIVLSATGHISLDKPGSDCGTKDTITITLDKNTMKQFMYSYIVEGNKLIELDRRNKDKYMGKTVKIRYSALCENKPTKDGKMCICNKCFGNLFYRINTDSNNTKYITNCGVASAQLMSQLKNINMKAFHEALVEFVEMDPMKAFEG